MRHELKCRDGFKADIVVMKLGEVQVVNGSEELDLEPFVAGVEGVVGVARNGK